MTNKPSIRVDVEGIGKALDWAWKIGLIVIPSLYGAFSFYSNQGIIQIKDAELEKKMAIIEAEHNKQSRDNIEKFASLGADITTLQHELDFYVAIQKKR